MLLFYTVLKLRVSLGFTTSLNVLHFPSLSRLASSSPPLKNGWLKGDVFNQQLILPSLGYFKPKQYHNTRTFKRSLNNNSDECHKEAPKINNDISIAQQAVSLLAQKRHTWTRLSNIIDLTSTSFSPSLSTTMNLNTSIADIGCDHGLLSIALAISGRYKKVIGVDVSQRALENALDFHKKVLDVLEQQQGQNQEEEGTSNTILPLEFRLGDGLEPLQPGEADALCIAGMGVETMLSILTNQVPVPSPEPLQCDSNTSSNNMQLVNNLDHLNCKILYLQPPKNRPKHLILLYNTLQENGWTLLDENICSLKNRWYITSKFEKRRSNEPQDSIVDNEKSQDVNFLLPGHFLSMNLNYTNDEKGEEFRNYVHHHLKWMDNDLKKKGGHLSKEEMLWRDYFLSML